MTTSAENEANYLKGERLWREHFSCGHTQLITTFIGDFDFEAARIDFPGFCTTCDPKFPGKMVELVRAEEVPVEEWNHAEQAAASATEEGTVDQGGPQGQARRQEGEAAGEVTRAEHLAFCKVRALEYVELGDLVNAVSSMISDLGKHDETMDSMSVELVAEGSTFAALNDARGVRRWIEGFN